MPTKRKMGKVHNIHEFKPISNLTEAEGGKFTHGVNKVQDGGRIYFQKITTNLYVDQPFITPIEFVTGQILKLLMPYQPDTLLAEDKFTGDQYILSELLPDFVSLHDQLYQPSWEHFFPTAGLLQEAIQNGTVSGAASVAMASYYDNETDSKLGNLGLARINGEIKLIKFDNDLALANLSMEGRKQRSFDPLASHGTSKITEKGMRQFPFFTDYDCYNLFDWIQMGVANSDYLKSSAQKPNSMPTLFDKNIMLQPHFIREKYDMALKILMIPESILIEIVNAGTKDANIRHLILEELRDRNQQMREVLMYNKEFLDYMKDQNDANHHLESIREYCKVNELETPQESINDSLFLQIKTEASDTNRLDARLNEKRDAFNNLSHTVLNTANPSYHDVKEAADLGRYLLTFFPNANLSMNIAKIDAELKNAEQREKAAFLPRKLKEFEEAYKKIQDEKAPEFFNVDRTLTLGKKLSEKIADPKLNESIKMLQTTFNTLYQEQNDAQINKLNKQKLKIAISTTESAIQGQWREIGCREAPPSRLSFFKSSTPYNVIYNQITLAALAENLEAAAAYYKALDNEKESTRYILLAKDCKAAAAALMNGSKTIPLNLMEEIYNALSKQIYTAVNNKQYLQAGKFSVYAYNQAEAILKQCHSPQDDKLIANYKNLAMRHKVASEGYFNLEKMEANQPEEKANPGAKAGK